MQKRVLFFLLGFLFSFHFSYSQNPLVKKWDKRYGGTNGDFLQSFEQTTDGGFIFGGYSASNPGADKTDPCLGNYDFWIVKTDSMRNKKWDKVFGGSDEEWLESLQQTKDGGYILGGFSKSGISGNKTQSCYGMRDYWIVKIDSLGYKQWDQRFGGTGDDWLFSVKQTKDGGYILGGLSDSPVSGNKTVASLGLSDYWIIKTNAFGVKQWDKVFGGNQFEYCYAVQQTTDGGYIIGGYSQSGINGTKTQPNNGNEDFWIVKLDSLGNQIWDKDFGGTANDDLFSLQQTSDNGYILAGATTSGISGDKTSPLWGYSDFWIVKTDSLGTYLWDRDYGGTNWEDEFGNITQTSDNGYLIAGTSYSLISGDKTEGNLGQEQTWVIKTDYLGNKQWDKTVFTTGHEEKGLALQTRDGCYAIANQSAAGIGGYKTQTSQGFEDYWIIKFCDTTQILSQPCLYHSALAGSDSAVTYSLAGGVFASYGCAPIDPTYWVSGSGATMTMTFTTPQNNPSFRIWGMNNDDSASVMVNGSAYPLTALSASYDTKIVCGLSPGPDGVIFVNGKLVGANNNTQGNYSYQNVTIKAANVSSIKVTAAGGAGWGFVGVSTNCFTSLGPAAHFNSSDTSFCNESGECIDFFDQSVGSPTSWKWSFPGAVPDTSTQQNPTNICYYIPGSYSVKLVVSNTAGSDSINVSPMIIFCNGPAQPIITLLHDTLCASTGCAYQWYHDGSPIPGAANQCFVPTIPCGIYDVYVTDCCGGGGVGCGRLSGNNYDPCSGINELNGESFRIYPNPAGSELWVVSYGLWVGSHPMIEIYNVLGEKVLHSEITPDKIGTKSEISIDISGLTPGVYFLHLKNEQKEFTGKLLKQ